MVLILLATLFLTTSHVSGQENATVNGTESMVNGTLARRCCNSRCTFKPEICRSDISAVNNCIKIESDLNLRTTDCYWELFKKKVAEGVKEVLGNRCNLCEKQYSGGSFGFEQRVEQQPGTQPPPEKTT